MFFVANHALCARKDSIVIASDHATSFIWTKFISVDGGKAVNITIGRAGFPELFGAARAVLSRDGQSGILIKRACVADVGNVFTSCQLPSLPTSFDSLRSVLIQCMAVPVKNLCQICPDSIWIIIDFLADIFCIGIYIMLCEGEQQDALSYHLALLDLYALYRCHKIGRASCRGRAWGWDVAGGVGCDA